jgi:hypothetical protein
MPMFQMLSMVWTIISDFIIPEGIIKHWVIEHQNRYFGDREGKKAASV